MTKTRKTGMKVLYDESKIGRFNYKRFSPEDRIRLRKLRIKIAELWLPDKETEIKEWRKKVGINSFGGLKSFADLSREQKQNFFNQAHKFIEEIHTEELKIPVNINMSIEEKQKYYCFILGVNIESKPEEIKKGYRRLVQIHHPDHGGEAEIFIKIKEAYENLVRS